MEHETTFLSKTSTMNMSLQHIATGYTQQLKTVQEKKLPFNTIVFELPQTLKYTRREGNIRLMILEMLPIKMQ